ncbi:hypothetical protein [Mesorhizobium prunaredense]|uniref:hypothetical protein n=1 Tax=Mesorhizobium prunaredense TaxID=1631249 RepID=UPI000984B2D2|nr:hypothetical protein [Mesorhizobium prunaredense]
MNNPPPSEQIDKFKEAARELETDQSEEAFDRVLKKVAQAKHSPHDEAVERAGKGAVVRPKKR